MLRPQQVALWLDVEGDFLILDGPQELLASLRVALGAGQCGCVGLHGCSCPLLHEGPRQGWGVLLAALLAPPLGSWLVALRVSCLSSRVTAFFSSAGFW